MADAGRGECAESSPGSAALVCGLRECRCCPEGRPRALGLWLLAMVYLTRTQ